MFGRSRFQANVIAPAKPCITLENVADFIKGRDCLIGLTRVGVIDAQVDQGIGLSLEHVMLTANSQSFLIMSQRALKVLQLAMKPANAVGHAWKPEEVAITSSHIDRLVERC